MYFYIAFLALSVTVATGHFLPPGTQNLCRTASKYHNIENSTLDDERIIGGYEVDKNKYPFMVRIDGFLADGSGFLCGGSLLHENYVVTAAHCVYDSEEIVTGITLHFGDHNLWHKDSTQTTMEIPLKNIYRHARYNDRAMANDIALIRLPTKAPISAYVKPICVASADTTETYQSGVALGWGLTWNDGDESEVLKQVSLPMLPHYSCRLFGAFNPNIMICAGNTVGIKEAICSGDSGGPFFVSRTKPVLAGISSFGSIRGCVTVGYGVVFVRVSSYIDWLRSMMGSDLCVE